MISPGSQGDDALPPKQTSRNLFKERKETNLMKTTIGQNLGIHHRGEGGGGGQARPLFPQK